MANDMTFNENSTATQTPPPVKVKRPISIGEFRRIALEEAKRQLNFALETEESRQAGGFVRRIPPPLLRQTSIKELLEEIQKNALEIQTKFPNISQLCERTVQFANDIFNHQQPEQLIQSYSSLLDLFGFKDDSDTGDQFRLINTEREIFIYADEPGNDADGVPSENLQNDIIDVQFVAAVSNMIAGVRRTERVLTKDERSAILIAYKLLDRGVQIPSAYKSIGTSGFRKYQTNLSVANPGDGHIQVTGTSKELLDGTVVHIEHIDRDGEKDREKLEPYRLPALINAARVRLHIGNTAPCTAYIGRPVFESQNFKRDLLKTVHSISSACTSMFMNGVADCKIGIERMSASEAIVFMQSVAGNVIRDSSRQYLSAAFNINLPINDDRSAQPKPVTNKYDIARLGIDLAENGKFEKVTWDGSSNKEPSDPIVEQLSFEELIELIHIAHEKGLETYISAGLQPHHMRICVHLGVDGVGIGTSLHDYNPNSGLRGQLKAERILEVLKVRNEASREVLGRGAALLAKLDRMFYEGTLPIELDSQRKILFDLMKNRKEHGVLELLNEPMAIPQFSYTDHNPVMQKASRVLLSTNYKSVGEARREDWSDYIRTIDRLVKENDIEQLNELLP